MNIIVRCSLWCNYPGLEGNDSYIEVIIFHLNANYTKEVHLPVSIVQLSEINNQPQDHTVRKSNVSLEYYVEMIVRR